jgi:ATP-dependent helicase HrpB
MEHAARRPAIDPEITQVDLSGLALELAAWGVSDPKELAWLDPPPAAAWSEAVTLLETLGALTAGRLTDTGRRMVALPLHPRLARMVADAGRDRALAVWLATVIDQRDPMRGAPSERPVDAAIRVRLLVDRSFNHPMAATGSLHHLRAVAVDLAERIAGETIDLADVDLDRVGAVLALAFPDRLAARRGSPGRFQLRTGTTAFFDASDPLAIEEFVVAADLDGRRRDSRIRLAGAIDRSDVVIAFAHQVDESRSLTWEGDRLVDRTERRLGGVVLEVTDQRPEPGEETTAALVERVNTRGLEALPWTDKARQLQERVAFLNSRLGPPWPDWSDAALGSSLDEWLAPYLVAVTGWDGVDALDLTSILRQRLGHELFEELDRLAPTHFVTGSGRRVRIDYSRPSPTVSVRVQEMFGVHETPRVGGAPLVIELLSPANRPIQITSDLAGFWSGSWQAVRKEMAGRYPKHDWPENP